MENIWEELILPLEFKLSHWHVMIKYRKQSKLKFDLNEIISASPLKFAQINLTSCAQRYWYDWYD